MNNDLISREALLKAMEEERQYLLARGQRGAEHILVHHCLPLIDNAPTVTPIDETFSTAVDKYGDNTFSVSVISSKGEKIDFEQVKKGEWKQRGRASFGFADFECTNCHCIAEDEPVETFGYNYCPNCGAKMKEVL